VDAVDAFKHYLREKPTSVAGLLETSAALLALQRTRESTAHAELAAGLARERADQLAALEMLSRIALASGDAAAARRQAAAATAIDSAFPLGDYVEGRLAYSAQRFDDATAFFERAVKAGQQHTLQIRGLHLYAGDALAHVERFEDAEQQFRREIQFFPDSRFAYLSLANLYQALGRFNEADQVLDAMQRAVPSMDTQAAIRKLRSARPARVEKP
jgi:tetratricopeptide (TPR) repeat protein